MEAHHTPAVRLGLKENWRQFSLLVLVNAFVGGMVGLERTVVPLVGSVASGALADRVGRKKVLLAGWIFGVSVRS